MHERLACDGTQQLNRTAMYFEYPSTAAMLLRNVRYGIELGFGTLSIKPFASDLNIAGRSGRASTSIAAVSETAGPTFVYNIN